EAEALVHDFVSQARLIGDPQVLTHALRTGALIAQARGKPAEAVRLLEDLDGRVPTGNPYRAVSLPDAVRIWVAAQAGGAAERLFGAVAEGTPRAAWAVVTAEAVLGEAQGELEQAAERYETAAGRWSEFGFALERGHALFGAGRCLVGLGRL